MNKLILGTIIAVGLCCATAAETWEDARNFTKQILNTSTFGYGNYCYIKGTIIDDAFWVWCEPGHLVHELPYSWNGYTIKDYRDNNVAGFAFYSK